MKMFIGRDGDFGVGLGIEVEVCGRCYALVTTSDLTFHGKFFHDDIDEAVDGLREVETLADRVTALEEKK